MKYMAFSLSELLNFDKKISNSFTPSEMLENILTTAVVGFLLVIGILAAIWILLELFGRIFGEKKKPKKETATIVMTETLPDAEISEESASKSNEYELVAAITAAISAFENKPIGSFRVVSFRKKN